MNDNFNFIFAIASFEHFENQKAVINGAFQITNNEGKIVIIIPTHFSYLNYGTHGFRRYSKPSLQKLVIDAGYDDVEIEKIGGLFSFTFHFFWRNTTRLLQLGIKLLIFTCFCGNKQKAQGTVPRISELSNDLMHLHLKTKLGMFFHKWILIISQKLDNIVPYFEIGYYCIARKKII